MVRPANGFFIVLITVSLFAGCGTTRLSRPRTSQLRTADDPTTTPDLDRGAKPHSAETPVPPPPAPPAYGISRIKSVALFRIFDRNKNAEQMSSGECQKNKTAAAQPIQKLTLFDQSPAESCFQLFTCNATDVVRIETQTCSVDRDASSRLFCRNNPRDMDFCCDPTASCGAEYTGCGPDSSGSSESWINENLIDEEEQEFRHSGLVEAREDPFFDYQPVPEEQQTHTAPDGQQTPGVQQPVSAPPPGDWSAYDEISLHRPYDNFFSSEFGQQQVFVDPPQWHGPHNTGSADGYHSATPRNTSDLEVWSSRQPHPTRVMIQPRRKSTR